MDMALGVLQPRTKTKLDLHAEKIHVWDGMSCNASLFSFFLNTDLRTEHEDGYV